jgi:hypothetical protein
MAITDISLLTTSPGPMARHPHSGANYHEGADIIAHLSRCLGPAGWSWTTGEHGYDELADQVYVVGTLTARVTVLDGSGDELVIGTTHTERGWQKVNRKRGSDELVDLGNDYKAADTDALKRAARLLGVGLDAWMQRPAPAARPHTNVSPKPEPAPAALPVDLSPAARDDLSARYVDLLTRARDLNFRASWMGADHGAWTDAQLGKYVELLENYIKRQEHAA